MVISINALDHIALRVIDVEQSLKFYCDVLGLVSERVSAWRDGQAPFPSVRINRDTLIDLLDGKPNGVNQDHFCLVIEATDMQALKTHFHSSGVDVHDGPDTRWGAHGNGTSLYIRDPDDNIVELRHY
jgi:extradiol dioxygenase family protein